VASSPAAASHLDRATSIELMENSCSPMARDKSRDQSMGNRISSRNSQINTTCWMQLILSIHVELGAPSMRLCANSATPTTSHPADMLKAGSASKADRNRRALRHRSLSTRSFAVGGHASTMATHTRAVLLEAAAAVSPSASESEEEELCSSLEGLAGCGASAAGGAGAPERETARSGLASVSTSPAGGVVPAVQGGEVGSGSGVPEDR